VIRRRLLAPRKRTAVKGIVPTEDNEPSPVGEEPFEHMATTGEVPPLSPGSFPSAERDALLEYLKTR
jgi:hypothetical protein